MGVILHYFNEFNVMNAKCNSTARPNVNEQGNDVTIVIIYIHVCILHNSDAVKCYFYYLIYLEVYNKTNMYFMYRAQKCRNLQCYTQSLICGDREIQLYKQW